MNRKKIQGIKSEQSESLIWRLWHKIVATEEKIERFVNPEPKSLIKQREQFLDLLGRENIEDYLTGSKQSPDYKSPNDSFQWIDRGQEGFSIFTKYGINGYIIEPLKNRIVCFDLPFLKRFKIYSKKLCSSDYRLKEASLKDLSDIWITHHLNTGDDDVWLSLYGVGVNDLKLPWEAGLPFMLAAIRIAYLAGKSELHIDGCYRDIEYLHQLGVDLQIDKWKCFQIKQNENIDSDGISKASDDTEPDEYQDFVKFIIETVILEQR